MVAGVPHPPLAQVAPLKVDRLTCSQSKGPTQEQAFACPLMPFTRWAVSPLLSWKEAVVESHPGPHKASAWGQSLSSGPATMLSPTPSHKRRGPHICGIRSQTVC